MARASLLVVALGAWVAASGWCGRTFAAASDPAPAERMASRSPRLPQPPGPAGYTSASACAECHRDEHASWQRSFHRSMTQIMETNSVKADFRGVQLEWHGERFTLLRRGNSFWAEVEDLSAPAGTPPATLPMELMTGSHHMQVFWVPAGAGNAQIGFPFTWLIPEQRWVPRESTFIRDPHAPPQIETWNMTCIRCHVTAGQPRPRRDQGVFDTRAADLGIACEACHGPASEHVAFRRAHPGEKAVVGADPIVQPARLSGTRASQVCGQCHGMRWFDSSEGWVENGFRYRPGDDLEATTPIIRPGQTQSQPWMRRVLERSPGILDEFFWSDGMIRVAGREFNGLLESACFQKGGLSCTTCHGLHDYVSASDQLKSGMEGDRACVGCHAPSRYGSDHTHHAEGSSGSVCYNCHMPHTTYALLGGIRQHQIDSPKLAVSLQTGRPNACAICHQDRSLAWVGDRLSEWYGHAKSTVPPTRARRSPVVDALLAGDAGQRALAAWYLGWEPGRKVSGEGWQAPLLIRTLQDPYAAVRIIALRSLRALPGYQELPAFPLETEAEQAEAVREATRRWKPSGALPGREGRATALFLGGDGRPDAAAIQLRSRERDDRPMRLRE